MNNNTSAKEIMPTNGRECVGAAPMDTLTEFMDIAAARAAEVLRMVYRINLHLFGVGEPESENKAEPKCFRDVLCEELALLDKTTGELLKLMEKLGC